MKLKWLKVFEKGCLGTITFLVAALSTKPELLVQITDDPQKAISLLVSSLVAGFIVAFSNFWKHKETKKRK